MKMPFDAATNPQKKNTVISVPNWDHFVSCGTETGALAATWLIIVSWFD
jgi:hypothetical protein